MAKNQIISVNFQGIEIGKMGYDENQKKSSFQYNPAFLEMNLYKNLFPYILRRSRNAQVFSPVIRSVSFNRTDTALYLTILIII